MAVWTGCSGESQQDPKKPATGSAGKGLAGKGSVGGSAGKATGTTGGTGATGGTSNSEGGNAGELPGGHEGGGKGGSSGKGGVSGLGGGGGLSSGGFGAGGLSTGGLPAGGSSGTAGTVAGGTATGGSAGKGTVFPPFAWICSTQLYGDGTCHCGCGASDPDCKHDDIDDCEVCNAINSCSGGDCPGRIDPDDPVHCLPTPVGWNCADRLYEDGTSCDCGCGAPDPDCEDATIGSCDTCDALLSCSSGACPGAIDPDDNAHCYVPPGWGCYYTLWGDGYCDCGCGVVDIDCDDATPASCDNCPSSGCTPFDCTDTLMEDDNGVCKNPPYSWRCATRLYNDGDQCDCGCGFLDPDCDGNDIDACATCNLEGSCSGQACPGTIDPDDITACIRPEAPPEWTCNWYQYADGYACDCGCGVPDLDCRSDSIDQCDRCNGCGGYYYYASCPGNIDPNDTTQCMPAPPGWTCDDDKYTDGYCDCGCGVPDLDCNGWTTSNYCSRCPEEGCAYGQCNRVDPEDNTQCAFSVPAEWTCSDGFYYDGSVCDCGCGAVDPDCASANRSQCGACPAGSCACSGGCGVNTCRPLLVVADNSQCL